MEAEEGDRQPCALVIQAGLGLAPASVSVVCVR